RRELGTRRALELQRRPANPEVESKRDLGPVVDGPRIRVLIEVKRDAKALPRQSWSEPSVAEGEADRDRAGVVVRDVDVRDVGGQLHVARPIRVGSGI